MRSFATCFALLCLTATAHAQDAATDEAAGEDEAGAEEAPVELPPPTLDEEEPVVPPEPLPAPEEEEESQPEILTRIGPGQHPEWEDDGEPTARDIAFETPGDLRSTQASPGNQPSARFDEARPEQPAPPFVIAAGAGWARFLSTVPLDFFRIEERFEATIPEFTTLRIGAGASQMFGPEGYLVGGGVRIGMGVPFCDLGDVVCDGVAFVQPGFMAGLTGPRFDLDALLSLRMNFLRAGQLALEGGYSLLFDGASLLHVTLTGGFLF